MDEKRLMNIKQQIDDAKMEVSQLKGRRANLMEQLQDQWKCKTVEQAEKRLDEMRLEVEELKEKIQDGIEKLEDEYEFE